VGGPDLCTNTDVSFETLIIRLAASRPGRKADTIRAQNKNRRLCAFPLP